MKTLYYLIFSLILLLTFSCNDIINTEKNVSKDKVIKYANTEQIKANLKYKAVAVVRDSTVAESNDYYIVGMKEYVYYSVPSYSYKQMLYTLDHLYNASDSLTILIDIITFDSKAFLLRDLSYSKPDNQESIYSNVTFPIIIEPRQTLNNISLCIYNAYLKPAEYVFRMRINESDSLYFLMHVHAQ